MSIWTLLRHRFLSFRRSSTFEQRTVMLLFVGLAVLYLLGGIVLLGVVLDDALRDAAPGTPPALTLTRWMGPIAAVYLLLRLFLEKAGGVDLKPYAHLPVRRSALARWLAATALFSPYTLIPLVFVVTFGAQTALAAGVGPALGYSACWLLFLALTTYPALLISYAFSRHTTATLGTGLVALGGIAGAVVLDFGAVLLNASAWLFGGVLQGNILPILVSLVVLGILASGYVAVIDALMRSDAGRQRTASRTSSTWLQGLVQRGPVWREVALEVQILLRNGQPRSMLVFAALVPIGVAVFGIAIPDVSQEDFSQALFLWLLSTGLISIYYGQRMFTWEGRCIEATMARPVDPRSRVIGKFAVLAMAATILYVLPLPFLLWSGSDAIQIQTAFWLYHAGVTSPAVIAASLTLTKASSLSFTLADTNASAPQFIIVLLTMVAPLLASLLVDDYRIFLWGLGLLGAAGLLALPLWFRGLTTLLKRRRYAMMEGYRASISD